MHLARCVTLEVYSLVTLERSTQFLFPYIVSSQIFSHAKFNSYNCYHLYLQALIILQLKLDTRFHLNDEKLID